MVAQNHTPYMFIVGECNTTLNISYAVLKGGMGEVVEVI
jgi:hypothetical protein